ncbi:response regulator [Arcicella aquatica]|uniref:histidine kinase n=1 Tax=Arcicella aquatica TaxID=217141 RepID=A0ABU5QVA8_9BACT|nr:response regulator [Arcicella aquatica]MEA5261045.1 response regulator [Arcicella aquatica]
MIKIVLIEDDFLLADNTKTILEISGFSCFVAEDGETGIQLIEAFQPDIVICDIMLGEMDGYEILRIIRYEKGLVNLPFIFLSARADFSDKRKGMNLGADDFITKPFTTKDLIETINSRLRISSLKKASADVEIRKNATDIFLSISNHEYLTPLNGIVNFTDLMSESIENASFLDINELQMLIDGIRLSGKRMLRITRKLLWYNQLICGINPWKNASKEEVDVIQLENKLFHQLKKSKSSEFHLITHHNASPLKGYDSIFVEDILSELYQNIIQFANVDYRIYSEILSNSSFLTLTLKNHFLGSYQMDTQAIKPFYQAHVTKDMNGTGLGLYIVNEWVKTIGGQLEVKCINSIFEVNLTLPIRIA